MSTGQGVMKALTSQQSMAAAGGAFFGAQVYDEYEKFTRKNFPEWEDKTRLLVGVLFGYSIATVAPTYLGKNSQPLLEGLGLSIIGVAGLNLKRLNKQQNSNSVNDSGNATQPTQPSPGGRAMPQDLAQAQYQSPPRQFNAAIRGGVESFDDFMRLLGSGSGDMAHSENIGYSEFSL